MRIILLLSLFSTLSSCSIYKSEFDCPANKGVGCMSLSNVNMAVDDGTLVQRLGETDGTAEADLQDAQEIPLQSAQTTIWFKEYKDKNKTHKEHEVQL